MHLTLFFTYGTSLRAWERTGMLEREVALYRKYLEKGHKVSFVTYGRKDAERYGRVLEGIELLDNRFRLPDKLYAKLIPLLHRRTLHRTDLVKSNQTPGALAALAAARFHHKPMLARSGYMHSEFTANEHGQASSAAVQALEAEHFLFSNADAIEVTTPMMRNNIIERIPDASGKIEVIPNYVDTDTFAPDDSVKNIDLVFIGRLNPQKNIFGLLDALEGLGLKTLIIGKGPQEEALKSRSAQLGLDIEWAGNVPNTELPRHINRSKAFILPSTYEGHPKTLIEAMATGATVIGTNVPGIREVIRHGETGWLCNPEPDAIRASIRSTLADQKLRKQLGRSAREFAIRNYALDNIVEREIQLMARLIRVLPRTP